MYNVHVSDDDDDNLNSVINYSLSVTFNSPPDKYRAREGINWSILHTPGGIRVSIEEFWSCESANKAAVASHE